MKFDIHKKEWEGLLYENGTGEKIVSHSKLKLWTFFWCHGERDDLYINFTIEHYNYSVLWGKGSL